MMPTATCSICFEELLSSSNPISTTKNIANTLHISEAEAAKALSKHSSTTSLASTATASTTTGCGANASDTTQGAPPSAPPESSPSRPSTSTSRSFSVTTECSNIAEDVDLGISNVSMSVSATPCGHVFHTICVSKWIDQHRHCPQCRQPVLASSRLVKLFFAEERVPTSTLVLYGSNYGSGGVRPGYDRHPSWIGMRNTNNLEGFVSDNKNNNPILHRPHSIIGGGASYLGASGNHWTSKHGDLNVEEARIIMDVMQCQMEDLEGECQKLRKRILTVEDQLQTKVQEVSALETTVRIRRSTSLSEEPEVATTSQNVAIAMSAAGPTDSTAETEPQLHVKRRRASSISNIQQSLLDLRREYDNLQNVSQELRAEIQDLNESVQRKDRDISSKEQRCNEVEESNIRLTADLEANSRLIADLRMQLGNTLANVTINGGHVEENSVPRRNHDDAIDEVIDVYSLYETIMDNDSDLPDGFSGGGRSRRAIRPIPGGRGEEGGIPKRSGSNCCHNFCKCMKCSFLIAFVLIICVGLLVILPLKIIFSEDRIGFN